MIELQQDDPDAGSLRDLMPDLTPMLDILFILLVFFMLTAGAVFQSLDVTLPASVSDDLPLTQEPEQVTLEIKPDGFALDGQQIADFTQLKKTLPTEVKADHQLIIACDKAVSVQRLLKVLTYLQSQGLETANILMQREATP